jgi:hypothetical protein
LLSPRRNYHQSTWQEESLDRSRLEQTQETAARYKKEADFSWAIQLDSPGGSVAAAMQIGRLFREKRVLVIVPYQAACNSACVLVLAGAVNRLVAGKVGIHRPYLEVPKQEVTPDRVRGLYETTLAEICAYFHEINVSEQLADAMLRIESERVRFLNETALISYGLMATDPIEQETLDLQEAQYFGLNRSQYIERRGLAAKSCPGRFGVPSVSTPCYQAVMKTGRVPTQSAVSLDFSQYGVPPRN